MHSFAAVLTTLCGSRMYKLPVLFKINYLYVQRLQWLCYHVNDWSNYFFFFLQVKNKPWDPSGHMRLFLRSAPSQTNTVLFLTIGKPYIYQHKSLGKSTTFFYPSVLKPERVTNNYKNWLPTYLIFSAIDIQLANIQQHYLYCIANNQKEYCLYISYIYIRCICKRKSYLHRK